MIETNPLPGNRALFEISDLMRGLRIAGDELYALPFLCMLIEDVGLNQVGPRTDRNAIIQMLTGFSSRSAAHQQACDWFQNIIPRIPDSELSDIVVRLRDWLSHVDIKAARVLIQALLQAVPSRAWRVTGSAPFSKELLTFMVDLARIPDGGNVKVPYPPSFSLSRFLPSTATAHFEVASEHEAGIFAIHEIITESESSFKVTDNRLGKSISGKQFSTVIAAPPFNGRTQGSGDPAEITCITQAMETLKDGGRAVICVTPGFLMRSGRWREFREHLTSRNVLEYVIQLPPRLIEGTSVAPCLIVLDMNRIQSDRTLFVDASDCLKPPGSGRFPSLDTARLSAVIREGGSSCALRVDNAGISSKEFDLSPARYIVLQDIEAPAHHRLCRFAELVILKGRANFFL